MTAFLFFCVSFSLLQFPDAFPHPEGDRQDVVLRLGIGAHALIQQPDGFLRQRVDGLGHSGQSGGGVLADGQAVQTHDGHIFRHLQTCIPQGTDGADGHHIGHGKNGGQIRVAPEQRQGTLVTVVKGEADGLILGVQRLSKA